MAFERSGGSPGLDHAIAVRGQALVQRPANERLVVNDKDGRGRHWLDWH
jgi:hypothetical protein